MEDRQEYRWVLDERGHIETIESCEKLQSQRLVEECMIAANRCAAPARRARSQRALRRARRLPPRPPQGSRQLPQARYLPDCAERTRTRSRATGPSCKRLGEDQHELPLRSMLNRLLTRARLSRKPGPAHGHVTARYTNCTSPLRKYLDFLVHLQIKAVLRGEEADLCDQQPELDALSKAPAAAAPTPAGGGALAGARIPAAPCRGAIRAPGPARSCISVHGFHRAPRRQRPGGIRRPAQGEGEVPPRSRHGDGQEQDPPARVDSPVRVTLAGVDDDTPPSRPVRLDPASGLREQSVASGRRHPIPPYRHESRRQ
jgi:hypothetical protein